MFTLGVNPNGVIDTTGRGYYVILINAMGEPIEATDIDTFTDFIRFDGRNFDWYHRQANQPNPGFNFVQAANINSAAQILPDGKTLQVVLDTGESTDLVNQFVAGQAFSVHALTTDNFPNTLIGRVIDTLGQGPSIDSNSLNTVAVRKGEGASSPLPPFYPNDPVADFIVHGDLAADYPYANFDIVQFEVTAR